MPRYAEGTTVSVDRSIGEIRGILTRYGADQFLFGEEPGLAHLGFRMSGRQVQLRIPLPRREDARFTETPTGKWARDERTALAAWEQAVRQRWRAVCLLVKAQLEAVESGIVTFDQVFLANLMLPDGTTAGEWLQPQIEQAYERGTMPALLPAGRHA